MKKLSKYLLGFCLLQIYVGVSTASDCQSEVFDRFVLVEKSGHKKPNQKPGPELSVIMQDYEILCPWQVEVDLNKDRKNDWVGIVGKNKKYHLLAYISGVNNYQVINVIDYPFFPIETYLETISTQELGLISGNKQVERFAKFAVVIHRLNKPSHAYVWDGKTFSHSYAFEKVN